MSTGYDMVTFAYPFLPPIACPLCVEIMDKRVVFLPWLWVLCSLANQVWNLGAVCSSTWSLWRPRGVAHPLGKLEAWFSVVDNWVNRCLLLQPGYCGFFPFVDFMMEVHEKILLPNFIITFHQTGIKSFSTHFQDHSMQRWFPENEFFFCITKQYLF